MLVNFKICKAGLLRFQKIIETGKRKPFAVWRSGGSQLSDGAADFGGCGLGSRRRRRANQRDLPFQAPLLKEKMNIFKVSFQVKISDDFEIKEENFEFLLSKITKIFSFLTWKSASKADEKHKKIHFRTIFCLKIRFEVPWLVSGRFLEVSCGLIVKIKFTDFWFMAKQSETLPYQAFRLKLRHLVECRALANNTQSSSIPMSTSRDARVSCDSD